MIVALLVLHIFVSAVLVTVVLMQAGRGGGLSGAFGAGGGGQALFGGRGAATFLSKATVVLGGLFFGTSLALAVLSARGPATRRSLIQEEATRARPTAPAPAQPGAPGTQQPGMPGTQQPGAPGTQQPAAPGGTQQAPQGAQPAPQGGTQTP